MSPIAILRTAMLLSVLLPAASPKHFDCGAVCIEKGQRPPDRPSGAPDRDSTTKPEPFGDILCYGALCLVVTKNYQKMEVPRPWWAPVIGTGRVNVYEQSDNKCLEAASHTVMKVVTEFDIKKVSKINPTQGTLDILATVSMTWSDPSIGVCLCGDHPELESYRLDRNFEDVMWVPDLTVMDSRNFRRVSGLVKLGLIKVSTASNHCAARVTQTFDFQATLTYPLNQNICLVRLGSNNHQSDKLAFISDRPKHKHSFELSFFKDYEITSEPMCEPLNNVVTMGYRVETAREARARAREARARAREATTFRVTGVNLIIGRKSPTVLMEYTVMMSVLVAVCIGWYCILSIFFIFVTFVWESIGYGNNGNNWLYRHDVGLFLVLSLAYIGFNLFWLSVAAHRGRDETSDNKK